MTQKTSSDMAHVTIEQLLDPKYRVQELTLLVDGDIYAHRAASVTDGRMYKVGGSIFKYKEDVIKFCLKKGIPQDEVEVIYEPEPFKHAAGALKLMLQSIENALAHKAPVRTFRYFLTNSKTGNFRNDILPHYKWNRKSVDEVIRLCNGDEEMARAILRMKPETFEKNKGVPVHKPEHLSKLKDFLYKRYDAEQVDLYEADDLIGIEADRYRRNGTECVIVSIDKDLDCIPGVHYNSVRDEVYIVSPEDALKSFYKQVLTGDDTDNIPGCPGVGEKTALKVVNGVEEITPENLYVAALDTWDKKHKNIERHEAEEKMVASAKCLWILQDSQSKTMEEKLWTPPIDRVVPKEDNAVQENTSK